MGAYHVHLRGSSTHAHTYNCSSKCSSLLGKHCTIVIMAVDYWVCFRMCIENLITHMYRLCYFPETRLSDN